MKTLLITVIVIIFIIYPVKTQEIINGSVEENSVPNQLSQDSIPGAEKKASSEYDSISKTENDELISSDKENILNTRNYEVALLHRIKSISNKKNTEGIGEFHLINLYPNVYSRSVYIQKKELEDRFNTDYNKMFLKSIPQDSVMYPMKENIIFEKSKVNYVKINNVELNISDGVIEKIRVITKDQKIFENINYIPLQNMNLAALNIFLYDVKDREYFIKINDFMYYLPKLGQNYLPEDNTLVMDRINREQPLSASVDLNSNLDIKVYSDFLSLLNQADNGIIQAEASSKFIFNSIPDRFNFFYLNFIEIKLRYSKFDSQNSFVQLQSINQPVTLSTTEKIKMNQYSYLNLDLKMNLIRNKIFQNFTEFNIGVTYDFTDIRLGSALENEQANMYSFYIEDRGCISRTKYFGLNYSISMLWQQVANTNLSFSTSSDAYFIPEVSIYYFPKGETSNKLFVRFKTFSNLASLQSYPLFQFGYSTNLSFIKK